MIDLPVIRRGLEIGEINLQTQEVRATSSVFFTCTSRVDCCSTMRIPASEYDIDKIVDQGYELDQIIKDASPIMLNPSSPHGPSHKAYILKTKPFDGTCTFLEDNLCKIHAFKPFACKLYPFALEFESDHLIKLVIHHDHLCQSIQSVAVAESNNTEILNSMMQVILTELKERGYEI